MEEDRELPEIRVYGEKWLVDVEGHKIINKGHRYNSIHAYDMYYSDQGYSFRFWTKGDILANHRHPKDETVVIRLKHFTEMDPEGVAKKYGLPVEEVKGKTDYEIMTDKRAQIDRARGQLTTIDIAGQDFYIDFPMKMLRPKDNFNSPGLAFQEIDYFFNGEINLYEIPYNTKYQRFEDLDLDRMVSYPEDVVVAVFPPIWQLDPIGFAHEQGFDASVILKDNPQRAHFMAKVLPSDKSWLKDVVVSNRKSQGLPMLPEPRKKGLRR